MTSRRKDLVLLTLIVLVPAGVAAWWWTYWPIYRQASLLRAAQAQLAADNLTRAEEALAELTRDYPDNIRGHFLRAQTLRRLGRHADAEVSLARAATLGLAPDEGRREFALLMAVSEFESAIGALQEELKRSPNDPELLEALAVGYARNHRWAEADAAYTRWLEAEPDRLDILLDRAGVRKEREQYHAAAADCREVLRRSPGHFQARLLLAHCLLSEANLAEAETELRRCRALRPERVEPLVGLTACAVAREDFDEAQTLIGRALELDASSKLALLEQADLHMRRQRYEQALPFLDHARKLYPEEKQVYLKLAQVYRSLGKTDLAKMNEEKYQEYDREDQKRDPRNRYAPQ